MIQRGLFFRSVSLLQFDATSNKISIEGIATELNKDNSKQVFQQTAQSPFYIATILPTKFYKGISETLDHFHIVDGKTTDPLMFTIVTDISSLIFGKSWFLEDSQMKYSEIVDFMKDLQKTNRIRVLVEVINFLMYGE